MTMKITQNLSWVIIVKGGCHKKGNLTQFTLDIWNAIKTDLEPNCQKGNSTLSSEQQYAL